MRMKIWWAVILICGAIAMRAGAQSTGGWTLYGGAGIVADDGAVLRSVQVGSLIPTANPGNELRLSLQYAWSGKSLLPDSWNIGCFDTCGSRGKEKLLGALFSLRHYVGANRSGAYVSASGGLFLAELQADYYVRNFSTGLETDWSRTETRLGVGLGPLVGFSGSVGGAPLFAEAGFMYLTATPAGPGGGFVLPVSAGVRF